MVLLLANKERCQGRKYKGRMKIDGLLKSSKRGFERHLCLADDDKQRDFAGWSVCWAGSACQELAQNISHCCSLIQQKLLSRINNQIHYFVASSVCLVS